jgi:hypothetical protein
LGRRGTGSNRGLRQREPLTSETFADETDGGRAWRISELRVVPGRLLLDDDIAPDSGSGSKTLGERAPVLRPAENVTTGRSASIIESAKLCDHPWAPRVCGRLGGDVSASAWRPSSEPDAECGRRSGLTIKPAVSSTTFRRHEVARRLLAEVPLRHLCVPSKNARAYRLNGRPPWLG